MKNIILLSITGSIGLLSNAARAQESKITSETGVPGAAKHKMSLFIGGGSSFASGKTKDSLFGGNGWNINGGITVPLFSAVGIEAEVSYGKQNADGGKSVYTNTYSLQEGTIAPAFSGNAPHANVFQILAGPRAEWLFGKIAVSPSVLVGYFSLKRNAYTLSGKVANPKQPAESRVIPFIAATDYTVAGFVVQPKIEIGYHFTSQLSVFAAGTFTSGPSVENSFSYWKPKGPAGAGNTYSYDQFASGAAMATAVKSNWQSTSLHIGLRYSWNKPGGAVSSSYAAGRAIQTGDTTRMPSRLSMTPTTTRQTQGSSFGEKVAGGLQSGGNSAKLVAGNPIPGVVVKGGKNPPVRITTVTSDNKGEVVLNELAEGSYLFTLTLPGQPTNGIVVKGGKASGTSFTNLTVNDKGQIGFEVLEAGDYKLIIEVSDPNNPPIQETSKEKQVDKATSGLKDTLKTNV